MVINLGTNDQYFIFRGQDGRDFMRGLSFLSHRQIKLVLPNGRRVNGKLSITKAHTFCLTLPVDDLKFELAKVIFDTTIDKYIGEAMHRNGRA